MDQEKYQQMQLLDYQAKQLQKIIENIDTQLIEITGTVDALEEFKKLGSDEEVLFPFANGIYAKGRLSSDRMFRVNIGSNVVVEKSIEDTLSMMQQQAKDLENYRSEVMMQLQKFTDKMNEFQQGME